MRTAWPWYGSSCSSYCSFSTGSAAGCRGQTGCSRVQDCPWSCSWRPERASTIGPAVGKRSMFSGPVQEVAMRIGRRTMSSRRQFLGRIAGSAGAALALRPGTLEAVQAAARKVAERPPGDVAGDEDFWREVQQAFTVDRTLINLNNG